MGDKSRAKRLRILGVVLTSLMAFFTMVGGSGTSCAAFDPTGVGGRFAGIAPFQWLYVLFVIVTLAIGGLGVRAAAQLVRGTKNAFPATRSSHWRPAPPSGSFAWPSRAACAAARCRWTWSSTRPSSP